jgi:hypothetical protein
VVLASGRPAATAALVIPDEQSWTVWGEDPAEDALRPVLDVGSAEAVLMPERIPDALAEPLTGLLSAVPVTARKEVRTAPAFGGVRRDGRHGHRRDPEHGSAQAHESGHGHAGAHGAHERHEAPGDHEACGAHDGAETHAEHEADGHADEGHEGHEGHGDMMAITGEPSADGLVMEPIKFSLGPLVSPLPGGVVADVTLDGDVVAECRVRATLRQPRPPAGAAPRPPDALSPVAWVAATTGASEVDSGVAVRTGAWLRVCAVELERAVSHLAWLRALARLLGWPTLVEAASAVLEPLNASRLHLPVELATPDLPDTTADDMATLVDVAAGRVARLRELYHGRRLARRTERLGVVTHATAVALALGGPVARASGVDADARSHDPLYRELGFVPAVCEGGDALARTLLRLDEVEASVALVRHALERARQHAAVPPATAASQVGVTLEGPRGPVHAQRMPQEWRLTAPGEQAALTVAGDAVVGLEWAAALVVLSSFDLSPWKVGP